VLGAIMEHFVAGRPVMEASTGGADADLDEDVSPEDSEIVAQIKELLDTRVRPAVASDGGDIVFRGFREGVVKLHMQGACSGCPSSAATLKHGIENMLRHYVPEVVAVEQVEF
jgi:Fe-S cluster biogenesis protein NfuA